jgi:arsenite/tail-anchored protein-transporting ATPase
LAKIASRGTFLDDEDIRQFLELSFPGLDELMALLAIAGWTESRAYDLIVVDTAPTGPHPAAADHAGVDPQLA